MGTRTFIEIKCNKKSTYVWNQFDGNQLGILPGIMSAIWNSLDLNKNDEITNLKLSKLFMKNFGVFDSVTAWQDADNIYSEKIWAARDEGNIELVNTLKDNRPLRRYKVDANAKNEACYNIVIDFNNLTISFYYGETLMSFINLQNELRYRIDSSKTISFSSECWFQDEDNCLGKAEYKKMDNLINMK